MTHESKKVVLNERRLVGSSWPAERQRVSLPVSQSGGACVSQMILWSQRFHFFVNFSMVTSKLRAICPNCIGFSSWPAEPPSASPPASALSSPLQQFCLVIKLY